MTPYVAFVVRKLADAYGCTEAEVCDRLLLMWITDHTQTVQDAGASVSQFKVSQRPPRSETWEKNPYREDDPQPHGRRAEDAEVTS